VGLFFGGGETFVDVQRAGTPVIVEAVGGVGILLRLDQDRTGADGVDGSGVHIDHLAGVDVERARRPVATASMNPAITVAIRSGGSTNSMPDR